ncbi:hypothetical protein GLOIN_2v1725819 [Rhizophagus irregularis DAOM 181602=DAOM 197198]|uniref:Uncharacterized protein n=1 Tax=Rhizophagus irregularis (strain DAOM 181602 / DAOM 197198 / MUCL 43194) TaxID=747089 RepID=A0A2P4P0V0_RHIID|nr:hypothetical protein GLOIN_2v1725819 [Rhizophagus irregularis DAOM 181602=DAOM 197198]POG59012.1 hypothetical protein GLOIN_2v1725819 [Rhizophagus irregularis DAOM 181602=DAOM 197198]GET50597.1 hypothetical protein GLOIN_2v1725819 [Rhizophagus irregularis DAOM 181602=DAOM 197198]|eukprot:XP_025165878.1 hypothetical protein GLOIN_2v1725819 [Rhizophagus irregularis DAOM 181602=DAOM 197198]
MFCLNSLVLVFLIFLLFFIIVYCIIISFIGNLKIRRKIMINYFSNNFILITRLFLVRFTLIFILKLLKFSVLTIVTDFKMRK